LLVVVTSRGLGRSAEVLTNRENSNSCILIPKHSFKIGNVFKDSVKSLVAESQVSATNCQSSNPCKALLLKLDVGTIKVSLLLFVIHKGFQPLSPLIKFIHKPLEPEPVVPYIII
jgi:hypothetical protein